MIDRILISLIFLWLFYKKYERILLSYTTLFQDLNFNYCCIYCNMAFLDLQERKDHVMNVPHFNAPWPMDEELCLFADFTAIGTGSGEIEEACDTIKCWYFYGMYVKYDPNLNNI